MNEGAAVAVRIRAARLNEKVAGWLIPSVGVLALLFTSLTALSPWFLVAGVAAALVGACSQALQNWSRSRALAEQRRETERRLRDADEWADAVYDEAMLRHSILANQLAPIARLVGEMAEKRKAERLAIFELVAAQVVDTILIVNDGVVGLRAVVYEIAADDAAMNPVVWASRDHRLAPNPLVRGTERGDKAFALLAKGEELFVDDIAHAPRDAWAGSGHGYNTFISCPITSSSVGYGMLTVDAVNTDDLTERDVSDLRLIAGLLVPAFAEYRRRR